MKIKRVGAVLAASVMGVALAACGSEDGSGSGGGDKPYVAIVSKGFQHQFWQAVKRGAEQQSKQMGAKMTFVGPPTEEDVEKQITQLQNALNKSPDALGFAALDSKASASLLQQAQNSDTPVIAFDSGVESDIPKTTVATDNKAAAAKAAENMAKKLNGKGKVAMVVHSQTAQSGTDRRDGFVEWMEENAPGIELVDPRYGAGDPLESANITKALISSHPDLDGIFASNEGSAIGMINGAKESGNKNLTLVGFDSGQDQIKAIKSGLMAGAVTQDPVDMGKELVKAAMKSIDGEDLPERIDTKYYWYDKSNIDDPKIQNAIYK